jgi:hypothetical protein
VLQEQCVEMYWRGGVQMGEHRKIVINQILVVEPRLVDMANQMRVM